MRSTNTRIRRLVCAAALVLTAVAAPVANAATAPTDPAANEAFVPGVTDFPSRLGEAGEQAAVARLAQRSLHGVPVIVQPEASGFDWGAATTGALAATLLLLGAALAVRVGTRRTVAVG